MILQNHIVRCIALFISDKNKRENFINSHTRKTHFAKLREDTRELKEHSKEIKQNILEIKSEVNLLHNSLLLGIKTTTEALDVVHATLIELKSTQQFENILKILQNIQQDVKILKRTQKDLLMNHTWLEPLTKNPDVYLSIACIAKNEGPYLKEWIEYHKIVGVQRFYFYDNESSDNTKEILEPYIQDGIVIYRYVVGKTMQCAVYQDAVLKARGQTRWLAVIDLDEFIVPLEKDSIPEFLKEYEKYPGVGIDSIWFDHNGHKTKPTEHGGLVTANYTRVPKHPERDCRLEMKSIVNPNLVIFIENAHHFEFKDYLKRDKLADLTVSENFEAMPSKHYKSAYYSARRIRVNHYKKSIEECRKVANRGSAWAISRAIHKPRNVDPFKNIETTHDYAIQKYLPKLKQVLGIRD